MAAIDGREATIAVAEAALLPALHPVGHGLGEKCAGLVADGTSPHGAAGVVGWGFGGPIIMAAGTGLLRTDDGRHEMLLRRPPGIAVAECALLLSGGVAGYRMDGYR